MVLLVGLAVHNVTELLDSRKAVTALERCPPLFSQQPLHQLQ